MTKREELEIRSCIQRMPLCGCGSTPKMWEIVRSMLARSRDSSALGYYGPDGKPRDPPNPWFYDAMPEHDLSATAVEFIAHVLGEVDFLEHGSSIQCAWLTPAGKVLLAWLDDHPDYETWPEYSNSCSFEEQFTLTDEEWRAFT